MDAALCGMVHVPGRTHVGRQTRLRACGSCVRKRGLMMASGQLRVQLWRSIREHSTPTRYTYSDDDSVAVLVWA